MEKLFILSIIALALILTVVFKALRIRAQREKERVIYMQRGDTRLASVIAKLESGLREQRRFKQIMNDPKLVVRSAVADRVYDYMGKAFFGLVSTSKELDPSKVYVQMPPGKETAIPYGTLQEYAAVSMASPNIKVLEKAQQYIGAVTYLLFFECFWLGSVLCSGVSDRAKAVNRKAKAQFYGKAEQWWNFRSYAIRRRLYDIDVNNSSLASTVSFSAISKAKTVAAPWTDASMTFTPALSSLDEFDKAFGREVTMGILGQWIADPSAYSSGFADFAVFDRVTPNKPGASLVFVLHGDEKIAEDRLRWIDSLLRLDAPVTIFRIAVQEQHKDKIVTLSGPRYS